VGLTGAREDLTVLFAVGYRVRRPTSSPIGNQGNEFKAKRDAMLKSRTWGLGLGLV